MYFFFFILLGLLFFLFRLHVISREDFVFIRKSISLEQLFNIALTIFFISFFFARVVYIGEHLNPIYINPLVFLLFPYYPGLSFVGGVIGGLLTLFYIGKRRHLPIGRVTDFFTLAFSTTFPFTFIVSLLIYKTIPPLFVTLFLVFMIITIFLHKVLYPKLLRGEIKEGVISSSFFLFFSLSMLIEAASIKIIDKQSIVSITTMILLTSVLVSCGFVLRLKNRRR